MATFDHVHVCLGIVQDRNHGSTSEHGVSINTAVMEPSKELTPLLHWLERAHSEKGNPKAACVELYSQIFDEQKRNEHKEEEIAFPGWQKF